MDEFTGFTTISDLPTGVMKEAAKPGSVLAILQERLNPQYIGWVDQYKAFLSVLGIDPDQAWVERDHLIVRELYLDSKE